MSGPDGIDERFGTLAGELRSGEVTASPELRERVRAIATRGPEPPAAKPRNRLPRRRLAYVLVPACALVAAAVAAGVLTSVGSTPQTQLGLDIQTKDGAKHSLSGGVFRQAIPPSVAPRPSNQTQHAAAGLTTLAPSGSRAQLYSVELALRVSSLSDTTKRAIDLARGWGGYVVSADSGSDRTSGTSYLVLRIPIVKIQSAVQQLTGLGTILANHVSIQDVQVQLNRRFSQMQALRVQITKLRRKLTDPNLTQGQRNFFEAAISQRQGALANLRQLQNAQKTRASFATVRLDLETKKVAAAAPPSKPSRIGRALHNIGRVLVVVSEVLLYVLLIGGPFAVLAALLWMSRRGLRRRSEDQLLAR